MLEQQFITMIADTIKWAAGQAERSAVLSVDCTDIDELTIATIDGSFFRLSFEKLDGPPGAVCRVCGCTDDHACIDESTGQPCSWAEENLCSVCAKEKAELSDA